MKLPIDAGTFKQGFLSGHGDLEVTTGVGLPVLVGDEEFPADVDSIALVSVGGDSSKLEFGGDGPIKCTAEFSVGAHAGIEIIRSSERSPFLQTYVPTHTIGGGQMALRWFADANGEASLKGSVPAITGLTFGVSGGANVFYSRLVNVPASTPARVAVLRALNDVRLPQHRGTPADAPAAGEAIVFGYGGVMNLKAGLTWGYSLTGTESLEAGSIEASIEYAVRLKAAVSFGYKLAGDFVMVAQSGARPGWVRLTVRKKRESQLDFGVAFEAGATTKLDLAAETVDEVLAAFLGADLKTAIAVFDELKNVTDLGALEKRAGKLLIGSLQKLSHTLINRGLDETSLGDFVAALGRVVAAYESIDQRILDLYEDFLRRSKIDTLRVTLERVAALKKKDDLAALDDETAWTVVKRLGGAELFSIIEDNAAFADVLGLADRALEFLNGDALKDLIDRLEADFKLDQLFGQLKQISSKEALVALTDRKLQGVVERVVGRAFEAIPQDAKQAFAELNGTLEKIDKLRTDLITKLESAFTRSVSMEINYAYTRAMADTALLDLEFDVGSDDGAALFQNAAAGEFAEVFRDANLACVRAHKAELTHTLKESSQLQLNFGGWKFGRLVELTSDTTISLEEHEGGLVQLFTSTESLKQRSESGRAAKEVSQSVFMFSRAGETATVPSPADSKRLHYVIRTLTRMSAGYEQLFTDDSTELAELYEYLMLARWLELIPPAAGDPNPLPVAAQPGTVPSIDTFISQLKSQFPQGFGKLSARYVVRYDDDTLRDAFTAASGDELESRISQSCRRIISGHLVTPRKNPSLVALGVAFAHSSPLRKLFDQKGQNIVGSKSHTVTLPAFLGKPLANRAVALGANQESATLAAAFALERDFRQAIRALDKLIDDARAKKESVAVDALSDAHRRVLRAGAGLDGFFGVNVLFGVMDDLIQQGRHGKGRRQSSMILEIEPPSGGKVTKYLMPQGGQ